MMQRVLPAALSLLLIAQPAAFAHAIDEYVQRTVVSLDAGQMHIAMRLVPGVEVLDDLLRRIDADADGLLSGTEQRAYAQRVLGDITLQIDGQPVEPVLLDFDYPSIERLREGLGEIRLAFNASVRRAGKSHEFVLDNHHEARISAYLANVTVAPGSTIHVTAQTRNRDQSSYRVAYTIDQATAMIAP
jgi:hypothetical protein